MAPYAQTVVDGIPATLATPACRLPDGRRGWYQRGRLDCLQAALATLVQVPYDTLGPIPTLRALRTWAADHGYTVEMHCEGLAGKWIGFGPLVATANARHTFVGEGSGLYFDPASGWEFPGGQRSPTPTHVDYAITLEPKDS